MRTLAWQVVVAGEPPLTVGIEGRVTVPELATAAGGDIGRTAAVPSKLAAAGISCNVIAAHSAIICSSRAQSPKKRSRNWSTSLRPAPQRRPRPDTIERRFRTRAAPL
jgi:hypothetical protein